LKVRLETGRTRQTSRHKADLSAARRKSACEHLGQWLSPTILTALMESYDFIQLNDHLANRTAATLAAQAPIVKVKKEDKAAKRKAAAGSRGVEVS
jgi:ribonuclease H2 subunit B